MAKPLNGAGGQHVCVFLAPHTGGSESELATARLLQACCEIARCRADERTSWQISQVPCGVMLQPLYRSSVSPALLTEQEAGAVDTAALESAGAGSGAGRHAPLELKLHVLFGVVLGGTLHTHPWNLWVAGDTGCIYVLPAAARKGTARVFAKQFGREVAPAALEELRKILTSADWAFIRTKSCEVAIASQMDELRCDWLIGDPSLGPRLGEVQYMGSPSRVPACLQPLMAYTFVHCHAVNERERRRRNMCGYLLAQLLAPCCSLQFELFRFIHIVFLFLHCSGKCFHYISHYFKILFFSFSTL